MNKAHGLPGWFIDQIQVGTKAEKEAQAAQSPVARAGRKNATPTKGERMLALGARG